MNNPNRSATLLPLLLARPLLQLKGAPFGGLKFAQVWSLLTPTSPEEGFSFQPLTATVSPSSKIRNDSCMTVWVSGDHLESEQLPTTLRTHPTSHCRPCERVRLWRMHANSRPRHTTSRVPTCATCHSERHAVPNQVAQSLLSAPKRPTFCDSSAFAGKKDLPSHPKSPNSPNPPQFRHPHPTTLPPCSNPSPNRTILPNAPIQPATRTRDSRPNAHFPTPRTSLPQTRSSDRQYRSKRRQNPAIGPPFSPRLARCPTGISGNERK